MKDCSCYKVTQSNISQGSADDLWKNLMSGLPIK